jgi:hypothetical protein
MWVLGWLTTYFSRFFGPTFQKNLTFLELPRDHPVEKDLVESAREPKSRCAVPL